jgi:predicted flap endonuclease-1-like 5' DNA nuclease
MRVDGRIIDTEGKGRETLTVDLVGQGGEALGLLARTDDAGYYGILLNAQDIQRVAGEKVVYLRVSGGDGRVLKQVEEPLRVAAGTSVRTQVAIPEAKVPLSARGTGSVIYRDTGAPEPRPATSTPLEHVRGIGPKTAAKLRAAGIPDVESLARTRAARLVEIAGFDAGVVRAEAEKLLRSAEPERRRGAERPTTPKTRPGGGKTNK